LKKNQTESKDSMWDSIAIESCIFPRLISDCGVDQSNHRF
jgi:hypothetical protein